MLPIYFWQNPKERDRGVRSLDPGVPLVEVSKDDLEKMVECVFCEDQVWPEMATCTDAGHICFECLENR